MKSILIGLLLFNSTAFCQSYIRTDSIYCLPIDKARLVIADALRLKVQVLLNDTLSARVSLLENRVAVQYTSFTNLLKIEKDKLILQKEITAQSESVAKTYEEEKSSLKKQVRRLKWERVGLGVIAVAAIVIAL